MKFVDITEQMDDLQAICNEFCTRVAHSFLIIDKLIADVRQYVKLWDTTMITALDATTVEEIDIINNMIRNLDW